MFADGCPASFMVKSIDTGTAKNISLAGVKRLTIHDVKPVTMLDLSTQFYASTDSIGSNRATVSHTNIDELNPYCTTDVSSVDLATAELEFLKEYTVRRGGQSGRRSGNVRKRGGREGARKRFQWAFRAVGGATGDVCLKREREREREAK